MYLEDPEDPPKKPTPEEIINRALKRLGKGYSGISYEALPCEPASRWPGTVKILSLQMTFAANRYGGHFGKPDPLLYNAIVRPETPLGRHVERCFVDAPRECGWPLVGDP